jgi:glucokinase
VRQNRLIGNAWCFAFMQSLRTLPVHSMPKQPDSYYLGFDIGGTKCAVILGSVADDRQPVLVSRQEFATRDYPTPALCLQRLAEVGTEMVGSHGLQMSNIASGGISCGGPLNSRRGIILSPPNLPGWDEVPVIATLQTALSIPVLLQNDANACALAEWRWGAARGTQTAMFLTFGTGLGAGLIIGGRLHAGVDDLAGEVGHWRLADDGPLGFGKHGSFEGFCSGGGLGQMAALKFGKEHNDAKWLAQLAHGGDASAGEIFRLCGDKLGQGLALLVDLLNPEVIVIGSIFARCESLLRPAMEHRLEREALATSLRRCQVVPAGLGEQIGDYAALAVALGME